MSYYWIIAKHSGKALGVLGDSVDNHAKIVQYTKKSGDDPNVDTQLWFFNGGFITNKKSGLVLDVVGGEFKNGTQIIQYVKHSEPIENQEWEYNHRDNTINLRVNRKFVLDVTGGHKEESIVVLYEKHDGQNQRFILQKWNNDAENLGRIVTNIINHNKFLPILSQNLLENLDDDEYYDVNIEVGNDPYVKIFHAHMVILNCRSPYFQRILSTYTKKNDETLVQIILRYIYGSKYLVQIKLPNILPETFKIILRYIYGGRISFEECDVSDIIKILVAAKELDLQELITYIQTFLIENKKNWMEQNFNLIYETSFEHNSFYELRRYCNDLISNEPEKIFNSPCFTSISEMCLISLVQSNNLQADEIQVWDHVLKWGLAQNPGLPSDPSSFSQDDFNALKETLQQCIPFIRFRKFTSREFNNKVVPYRKIFPKKLYEDLLLSFPNPNSRLSNNSRPNLKTVDSKIIAYQHAELISKWIDKLEITDKLKNSYEFKLLYRGSRDGLTCEKFHEICDNQSRTVTIVKVKGSNEILGGYNPIEWKSDEEWGVTKDSFIFSFKNEVSINNCILSRVINEKKAVLNSSSIRGPSFGNGDLFIWGFDYYKLDNYCRSSKTSYENPIRKTEDDFLVEECEVFRLMFKF